MEKLFAGPFGLFLVIAQAGIFIYLMRGLFETVSDDDSISRPIGVKNARKRPHAERARRESSWQGSRGWSRNTRTLETFYDAASGAMTARVVEGPYSGRRLEDLDRNELMRLHEGCRVEDPDAADFLATYIHRRFAEPNANAGFGEHERERRAPPPADGRLTRERAFAILGLAVGASEEEIHRAHRALIKKHHPDHGGSHAKAAEINQAKDFLLD